jgi:hypothetical protein
VWGVLPFSLRWGLPAADHHGMELGFAAMRLDASGVTFLPSRLQRWRGAQEVSVPYTTIAGLTMTEPQGLARGTFTVRLADGDEACSLSFGSSELRAMRRVHIEVWRRVRTAREAGGGPGLRP